MWFVYILECSNKALYVGMTEDVELRFKQHLEVEGKHYTAHNRPTKILYSEGFKLKSKAESREKQLKRWTKEKKLALVSGNFERLSLLSVSKD